MLSDHELGRVQELIGDRDRIIQRIKGVSSTLDQQARALVLTTMFKNLRSIEHELTALGVLITPFDPRS